MAAEGQQELSQAQVHDLLRREVGGVCPVEGCECPLLEYHHFDPPQHVEKHNRPEGMIAMCIGCHQPAYESPEYVPYLRGLKNQLSNDGLKKEARAKISTLPASIMLEAGGALIMNPPAEFLVYQGRPLLWWTSKNGGRLLNLDIRGTDGRHLLQMRDNNWVAYPEGRELHAKPKQRYLDIRVPGDEVWIRMELHHMTRESYENRVRGWAKSHMRSDGDQLLEWLTNAARFPMGWIRLSMEMKVPRVRFTPTEAEVTVGVEAGPQPDGPNVVLKGTSFIGGPRILLA